MHSLIFTLRNPYPPIGGAAMRVWQDINLLRRLGRVTVVSSADFGPEPPALPLDVELQLVPRAEGRRRLDRRLLRRGLAGLHRFRYGRDIPFVHAPFDGQRIRALLAARKPDLIIFDEPWQFSYLAFARETGTRLLHISHNVEALLRADASGASGVMRVNPSVARVEGQVIAASDQVWACSEADRAAIHRLYGAHHDVRVVPNGLDERAYRPEVRDPTARSGWTIMFPGLFSYRPNAEAADLILEEILPRVRARHPGARAVLVGKNPTRKMLAHARHDPGVRVTGFVDSTAPYFADCDCVVAPLLTGSGTRLKLLEAFALGRPVVSTTKGAEGLDCAHEQHLLIGDSPAELADAICRLAEHPDLTDRITAAAAGLFQRTYSWGAIAARTEAALSGLARAAA